jgi:hypothetical protein
MTVIKVARQVRLRNDCFVIHVSARCLLPPETCPFFAAFRSGRYAISVRQALPSLCYCDTITRYKMHDYTKSNRGQQFVMKLSKDPRESTTT